MVRKSFGLKKNLLGQKFRNKKFEKIFLNMPKIVFKIKIKAILEICFDLARSIDLHKISIAHTNEEAIAGITTGLIGFN